MHKSKKTSWYIQANWKLPSPTWVLVLIWKLYAFSYSCSPRKQASYPWGYKGVSLTELFIGSYVKQPLFNQTCLGKSISEETQRALSFIWALQISGTDHTVLSGWNLNKSWMLFRCHRTAPRSEQRNIYPTSESDVLFFCKARKIGTKTFVT